MSMYYNYNSMDSSASSMGTWLVVAFILGIVGSILAYFLFLKPDKKYPSNFVNWLREFLNFDKMVLEMLLKIIYMFFAIFITVYSFSMISVSFLSFLLILVFGNLLLRIGFEFSIMMIMIWKNTTEINKKMKK